VGNFDLVGKRPRKLAQLAFDGHHLPGYRYFDAIGNGNRMFTNTRHGTLLKYSA
jgi:hypothetical protein